MKNAASMLEKSTSARGELNAAPVPRKKICFEFNLERADLAAHVGWAILRKSEAFPTLLSSAAVTLPPTLFLADYIINIAGFEFSTGTGRILVEAACSCRCGKVRHIASSPPRAATTRQAMGWQATGGAVRADRSGPKQDLVGHITDCRNDRTIISSQSRLPAPDPRSGVAHRRSSWNQLPAPDPRSDVAHRRLQSA